MLCLAFCLCNSFVDKVSSHAKLRANGVAAEDIRPSLPDRYHALVTHQIILLDPGRCLLGRALIITYKEQMYSGCIQSCPQFLPRAHATSHGQLTARAPCMQKAFLRSEEDQRAGRDPSTFAAGHSIEFCVSQSGDCTDSHDDPDDNPDDDPDYDPDDNPDDDPDDDDDPGDSPSGRHDVLHDFCLGAGVVLAAIAVLAALGVAGVI